MNIVTLLQPPGIVFGNGCAPQCVEFLAERRVKRVLLVSSSPVLPTLGEVKAALQKSGVEFVLAPPVDREPTQELFKTILTFARAEKIDGVLGIGGGSAIDVAKLVAALAAAGRGAGSFRNQSFVPNANCRWSACRRPPAPARKFRRTPFCWMKPTN